MFQPSRTLFPLLLALSAFLCAETDLEKARRQMQARSFPEAKVTLERVLQAEPRHADALAAMGELQLATQDPVKAAEYANKAIQINPGKASYHLLRGNALGTRAGQVSKLRAMTMVGDIRGSYEKAVQLEPGNRSARLAMFSYYLNAPGIAGGGLDKALAFGTQTVPLDPSRGHYMKGLVLQRQKNPGGAQAEYRLALAADPRFSTVHNLLGYVELEMKQVDLAMADFRKQVELDPENPNSHDSLADGWMAKGSLDEAIKSYRKALSLNPLFVSSLRGLGKVLELAGRRDEAIQHYRQCAQLGVQRGIPQMVSEAKERLKGLGVKE